MKGLEELVEQLHSEADELWGIQDPARAGRRCRRPQDRARAPRRRAARPGRSRGQAAAGPPSDRHRSRRSRRPRRRDAGAMSTKSLDRLRSLAQRIHPPQLEAAGLPAALRSAAARCWSSSPDRGRPRNRRLPPGGVRDRLPLCIVAAFERLVTGMTCPAIWIRARTERWRSRSSPRTQASTPADAHLAADPRSRGGPGGPVTITAVSGRRHTHIRRLAPDPLRR